jgi:hypothetical protein
VEPLKYDGTAEANDVKARDVSQVKDPPWLETLEEIRECRSRDRGHSHKGRDVWVAFRKEGSLMGALERRSIVTSLVKRLLRMRSGDEA